MAKQKPAPDTQAERVKIWKGRIDAAIRKRKKMTDRVWKPCLKAIMGNFSEDGDMQDIRIQLAMSGVQTMRSSIYFKNPKPNVFPKRPDPKEAQLRMDYIPMERRAENMKFLLEHFIDDDDGFVTFKNQIKTALTDAFYAMGILREVYMLETEKNPGAGEPMTYWNPENSRLEPVYGEDGQPMLEPDEKPVAEHFKTIRVSPFMMLIDPLARQDFVEGTWLGEEMYLPLEDVMADSRFQNKAGLKDAYTSKFDDERKREAGMTDSASIDPRTKFVKLYYIEDLKHRRILMLAENYDRFLMDEPMPNGMEGGSYTFLQFQQFNGDEFYGVPPMWNLVEPQKAYNEASNHLKVLRFHDVAKVITKKGAFSKNDRKRLEDRTDNRVIESKSSSDPSSVVHFLTAGQPRPLDTFSMDKAISEFNKLSGLTAEKFAGQASADTLGQSQLIQQQSDIKEAERMDIMMDALRMTLRKKMQRIQSTFLLPITKQSVVPGREPEVVTITDKAEIAGEFNLDVELGSTQRKNPLVKRAMFNDAVGRAYSVPQIAQNLDDRKIAEMWVEENELPEDVLKDVTLLPPASAIPGGNGVVSDAGGTSPGGGGGAAFPPMTEQDVVNQIVQRGQGRMRAATPAAVTGVQS